MREKQKAAGVSVTTEGAALWPPLRLASAPQCGAGDPRAICSSGVLHGAIAAVLHRGVHRRGDTFAPHAPPDHVLALAVYLLRVACDTHAERAEPEKVSLEFALNLVEDMKLAQSGKI